MTKRTTDGEDVSRMLLGGSTSILDVIFKSLGRCCTTAGLSHDEDFEANAAYIRSVMGNGVTISTDLPLFHSECGLAISTNSLSQEIDASMRAAMKMQMERVEAIQLANGGYISWKKLITLFDSNGTQFQPLPDEDKCRADYLTEGGWHVFKFNGGASAHDMSKAHTKMQTFVEDPAIWNVLKIDLNVISELFGRTGVRVKDFETFFAASDKRAHVAIDCGAIRFPRKEDPYFTLYRFRVIVMKDTTRFLFVQHDDKVLEMSLTTRKYQMTQNFMSKFNAKVDKETMDDVDEWLAALRPKKPNGAGSAA